MLATGIELISREEAREKGLKRYFTGEPCKRGHLAERYVSTGRCVPCTQKQALDWHFNNHERSLLKMKKRHEANREAELARMANRYATHREEACAVRRQWRLDHPDRTKEAHAKWRRENRTRWNEIGKGWRDRYPEKYKAKNRRWRENNPDGERAIKHRRRARERNAPGSHTAQDIQCLYALQRALCAACKVSLQDGYHVDHVMPLARGGSNGPENLQLLCPPCNWSKNAKHPDEWTPPTVGES